MLFINSRTLQKRKQAKFSSRQKVSFLMVLAMLVMNIPTMPVAMAVTKTFDFEANTTGSTNVGDPSGNNKTVTQTVTGHTICITQDVGNLLVMDAATYNGAPVTNLNGNAVIVDGGYDVTNSLTITVTDGYTFDLNQISVQDQTYAGPDLVFTTSKGSVTKTVSTGGICDVISLGTSTLQGVSSVVITKSGGGTIQLQLDDIILDNIIGPLAQVSNVQLSSSGVASWDNVANESSYSVQLYKNGSASGAAVSKTADTLSHDFLSAMRAAGAGAYTVKVTAIGNGTTYTDGAQSTASSEQTIIQLAAVSAGLTWTGDVAHFTPVTNGVSYDVQLYKDGSSTGSPVNVLAANVASGVDFSSAIGSGGVGVYTYKVTSKGNSTLILDGSQSSASNNNTSSAALAQVANVQLSSSGVASWDDVSNESSYDVQLYKDGSASGSVENKGANVTSHDFLAAMRAAGAGDYTVKVTAKGNGSTYTDGAQSTASAAQTVTKLATVTAGLTWTSDVAHFTAVANGVSYDVQLFKDGSSTGSPVNVLAANVGTGADFAAAMSSGGVGVYSYKVTAKGNATLILDADQSAASNNNTKSVALAQVANVALSSSGVATWDDVSNESSYSVQLYKDGSVLGSAVSKGSGVTSHDFLSAMRAGGAGDYTVKVTAIGNGTTYTDGPESVASAAQTIIKLATVSAGLTWTGDVAHFTPVSNGVSYDVQLYKDGSSSGSPVNVLAANVASGADLAAAMTSGGVGVYTYKVTAKGNATLILDGDQSTASNNNTKSAALSQVANVQLSSSGVATWDNLSNESSYSVQLYKDGSVLGSAVSKSADVTSHDFIAAMRAGGAGDYTVKVTAIGNGTTYTDGAQSAASATQTVIKLATVSAGLTWTGDVAHFTAVSNGVSYDVQLFKDGSSTGSPVNVLAANVASGADFAAAMSSGGNGIYTYKVTAKGNATLILDGDQSAASNNNIKSVALAQVANVQLSASGVATWDDVSNETSYDVQLYKDGSASGSAVSKGVGVTSHDFLAAMRAAGAGDYTVKVTAIGNGTTFTDGAQSTASGTQTVVKLATVSAGLTWTSDVAHFTAVSNGVSYDVQLYKDGSSSGSPVNVLAANVASGVDFASALSSGGIGVYTYKVTAKGNATLILDGDQSTASNNNIKATPLAQVTNVQLSASGVATWDNVSNETGYDVQLYKDGSASGSAVSKSADVTSHDFLSAMRAAGAGDYTVKVTAKGNGTTYSDGSQSAASSAQTVIKLATVSAGMSWTGDVAHFTAVSNGVSYDVQLYKDGSSTGSPVNVLAANVASGVDYASDMSSGGIGVYTYKITAKGNATLILDGDQSSASNNNIKSVALAQVANVQLSALGVATWDDVSNESSYSVQLYKDGTASGSAQSKSADATSHDFLAAMRAAGAGDYTVKVTAVGNGTTYSNGAESAASSAQTVTKLATVSAGLTWSGDVANFTAVANAVSYDVQLYKDGSSTGSPVNVLAANVASGADFAAAISSGGIGVYTYKVTAKGNATLLIDADQSGASNNNTKSVALAQVANVQLSASGVATWDDVSNETSYEVQLYKDGSASGGAVSKGSGVTSHDFLSAMRAGGSGDYTVKVTAKGNGSTYTDGAQSAASSAQTIVKLATVNAGLTWTGDVAHFTTVSNAISYDVQLYKDGNSTGSPINVLAANAASGADFASAISSAGNGVYTYKVTSKGNATLLVDGEQSAASNNNTKSSPLGQVINVQLSGSGVASWDNLSNESSYAVQLYKDGSASGSAVSKNADVTTHDFLSAMRAAGVGVYTVKVTAIGNGVIYTDGAQSAASDAQTVTKLSAVSDGMTWSGNVAQFTAVSNGVSYDVQLYKDGSATGSPINVLAANVANGADFTTAITNGGNGTYTYKVTAKGDALLLLDADQSAASTDKVIANAQNATDLTNLIISGSPSNYSFSGNVYDYNGIGVAYEVDSIYLTPIGSGDITVNGTSVASNTSSAAIQLEVGVEKTIDVTVAETGKISKVYTLKVTRSQPSISVPSAPTAVTAVAGNQHAVVSFTAPANNGGSAITSYTVLSSPGGISVSGSASPITVTGLSNGTSYLFTVTATNAAGTSAPSAASSAVVPLLPEKEKEDRPAPPTTPTSPSTSTPTPVVTVPQPDKTGVNIFVNGKVETAAVSETKTVGNQVITTVTVDAVKVDAKLATEGNKTIITIPVSGNQNVAIGMLNGQTVKNMQNKEAILQLKTDNVVYTLPASQINIDAVSQSIGQQVALKDISVDVKITQSSTQTIQIVADTANKNKYQVVVNPIDFDIVCRSGEKEVAVSKFNAYVERTVSIPETVDPSKITTGVVLNADGTFSHVPTSVINDNGQYFAKINSLTNSSYSVIWSPKTFADAENHWAKTAVNDMGSRLIIKGVDEQNFEPNRAVTRAEFTEILVNALGLKRPGTGKDIFTDVNQDDWCYDSVCTASEYDLISGYGKGDFGINDQITREQAMVMLAKAMKLTNLEANFSENEQDQMMGMYKDMENASAWALPALMKNVKVGIVSGKQDMHLAPKDAITRAEVAVMIRNLLIKSNLINEK